MTEFEKKYLKELSELTKAVRGLSRKIDSDLIKDANLPDDECQFYVKINSFIADPFSCAGCPDYDLCDSCDRKRAYLLEKIKKEVLK